MAEQSVLERLGEHRYDKIRVAWYNGKKWLTTYAGTPPTWLITLDGEKGKWLGYDNGFSWSAKFGWPDDLAADLWIRLYERHKIVGHLWFYSSPQLPDKKVLFVFTNMETGQDGGQHNFVWWGEVRAVDIWPFYREGEKK